MPHPMLRFKNFKTENSGRGAKTFFVHPGMLEGGKEFRGGGKHPFRRRGWKGREGEGREEREEREGKGRELEWSVGARKFYLMRGNME